MKDLLGHGVGEYGSPIRNFAREAFFFTPHSSERPSEITLHYILGRFIDLNLLTQ